MSSLSNETAILESLLKAAPLPSSPGESVSPLIRGLGNESAEAQYPSAMLPRSAPAVRSTSCFPAPRFDSPLPDRCALLPLLLACAWCNRRRETRTRQLASCPHCYSFWSSRRLHSARSRPRLAWPSHPACLPSRKLEPARRRSPRRRRMRAALRPAPAPGPLCPRR